MDNTFEWLDVNIKNTPEDSETLDRYSSQTAVLPTGSKAADSFMSMVALGEFSWWILKTKKVICKSHEIKINSLNGIEAIRPISKHRIKFGFCDLFDIEEIKKQIETIFLNERVAAPVQKDVANLVTVCDSVLNHYTLYQQADGSLVVVGVLGNEAALDDHNEVVDIYCSEKNSKKINQK